MSALLGLVSTSMGFIKPWKKEPKDLTTLKEISDLRKVVLYTTTTSHRFVIP